MLSRLFGARSQGAEPYDFQWRTHPDNPGLVAASHGPWFRNTTVGDPADYAHEFYLLGVNARLAVASHFELLPKVGQAEARASLDHLHARLEDSLLLVARIGAFAGDRGLIRQFQRMIGAYRTLLLHDFAGLGGNASPEASRQAIEQLLPFGEAWVVACREFPIPHANSRSLHAADLADFLNDVAVTALTLVADQRSDLVTCLIRDSFTGSQYMQFKDDQGRLLGEPQAAAYAEAWLLAEAESDEPPEFAAEVWTGWATLHGRRQRVLAVNSYELGAELGNHTIRPFQINRRTITLLDAPIFVQTLPNRLAIPDDSDCDD